MIDLNWQSFLPPIQLSLKVSFIASVVVTLLGIVIARWMTRRSFAWKPIVETLFMLPLVLPPTVIGFLLLLLLGRNSWIGSFIEWLSGAPLLFTWISAVIASVVVAFPLVYQTMKVGYMNVDRRLEDAGRSSGATEWQVFRYITLPLASPSLMTAYILGFARSLGEFGATLMIAGNIPGRTQTIPTAIYVAVESGNLTMAWAWTIAIIVISFGMLLITYRKRG